MREIPFLRRPYLGRAVATAGDAAEHRLGLAACLTGVTAPAPAAVVFFVDADAAKGVAARREARMVGEEGREKKVEEDEKGGKKSKCEDRAWPLFLFSVFFFGGFISFVLSFSSLFSFLRSEERGKRKTAKATGITANSVCFEVISISKLN